MPVNNNKEVSCYSTALLIKYALEHNLDHSVLFSGIECELRLLQNHHEWTSMDLVIQLMKNFERAGGNLFEAGIEITKKQTTNIQLLFLKVFSIPIIISKISDFFSSKICSTVTVHTEKKSEGFVDVVFSPKTGSAYSKQICDFDRGCTYATLALKRLRNFQLTEVTCAANHNVHECRYRLTWTPDPPILERLKNFFIVSLFSQKQILAHMEETYNHLQDQYREILGIKDFYSHIMSNMNEGVLWLDADGMVSFANKGFCLFTEKDKPEDVVGSDFRETLADNMQGTLSEILTSCRSKPGVPCHFELKYKTAKNEERLGQTVCLWVDSAAPQKPGFLLSIRDITEKRAMENKLFAVENRYRTLYENSPAIIVGIDNYGKILYANPAMAEQSGYTEEELKNMYFTELLAPSADSHIDANTILSGLKGRVGLQETHYRTKSGKWNSVALATFPLFNDKCEEIGLGTIGVDVTETKRLNEMLIQTQRMDLLGQMAGGLAHDFKNLLTVISGYGKMIDEKSTEPKIREFANNIMLANERAFSLTKNLLTFSRGETVKNEPFVVNDVMEEVEKLLPAILGSKVQFTAIVPDDTFTVRGDAGKINQCLLNLCINARDAIVGTGKVGSVTMRLIPDNDPEWILLKVEDTGPGIPPDIIGRIFDPFFSTKKKGEGTGLGLSVVYGIVKSHGGDITVDSRPGDGTTFTIRLPLLSANRPLSETIKASEAEKPMVIVIETDMVFRNYCSQILGRKGYQVLQFALVRETAEWLHNKVNTKAIVLVPVVSADEVMNLPGFNSDLTPLWIAEEDEVVPESLHPCLRRPFPPAALVANIREYDLQTITLYKKKVV
jgi:PAS domain S-box-containing protein